jgi:tRNA(His) 5'-end guanylyltransferase
VLEQTAYDGRVDRLVGVVADHAASAYHLGELHHPIMAQAMMA